MVVQVIDFERHHNLKQVIESIENNRYLNVRVRDTKKVEIDWTDEHPLNNRDTAEQTFLDLFKEV